MLVLLGLLGYGLALPGFAVFGARLDAHTLLFSSLFVLVGYQSVLFGPMAEVFAIGEGLLLEDPRVMRFFQSATLEKALALSSLMILASICLLGLSIYERWSVGFGPLDYPRTMRLVVPGVTLGALGFQIMLSSFFVSVLGLGRR